jgi:hypothetical protein
VGKEWFAQSKTTRAKVLNATKNVFAFILGGLLVVAAVGVLFFGAYLADVHDDRKKHIKITGLTPVFSGEGCFPESQQEITTLMPIDNVSVRRVRYPKECMLVRVRLKSGQEGFLVSGKGQWILE